MKLMPVHLFTKNQNFHLKTNLISIGLNEWICQTVQWNANALIYYLCFATLFVWVNCWRETMAPWKRQQQQQQRWFLEWITFACLGRRAVGAEGVGGATCHGTIRFWQISETYHIFCPLHYLKPLRFFRPYKALLGVNVTLLWKLCTFVFPVREWEVFKELKTFISWERPIHILSLSVTYPTIKEERSGGTVDWPPKLMITNLVGLFGLPAGCWIP